MKKIKAIVAFGCAILMLSGCKLKDVNDNADMAQDDSSATQVQETAGEVTLGVRPELYAQVNYTYEDAWSDGEYEEPYLIGHYDSFTLSSMTVEAYPAFADTFKSVMNSRNDNYEALRKQDLEDSKRMRSENENHTFVMESDLFLRRADQKVVSYVDQLTEYTAGAHGFTSYKGYNFDVQAGKEIQLEDVITDEAAFKKDLANALLAKYTSENFIDLDKTLAEMTLKDFKWTLSSSGVTFYYAYDISAYAIGVMSVDLPYNSGFVNANYAPDANEGYIMGVPLYFSESERIDSVLEAEGITFTPNYDPEAYDYSHIQSLTVDKDGDEVTIPELYVFAVKAYLMHLADGKEFLMVMTTGESDWRSAYVISLNGKLEQVPSENYGAGSTGTTQDYYENVPSDPASIALSSKFNLLCSFDGSRRYELTDNGTFNPIEEYYTAVIPKEWDLVSKVEITVPVVEVDGTETGETVTLPAKTSYRLIRTNGENDVDCTIPDGRIVRFHLEDSNGFGYIDDLEYNGVNCYDLFEMLWYAG
ncbi:MAG: DUF3298 domain-containing protein [Pseudobutyrivibrio sp.]|nr:DUF3298 domain-containing protein [Pseudobutyrivibrio sp.]